MHVHVCSLSRLADTVEATGARHVVTLINQGTVVERPRNIAPEDHLFLGMNDIVTPMDGYIAPAEAHVERLLGFVDGWWRTHAEASPWWFIAGPASAARRRPPTSPPAPSIPPRMRRCSPTRSAG